MCIHAMTAVTPRRSETPPATLPTPPRPIPARLTHPSLSHLRPARPRPTAHHPPTIPARSRPAATLPTHPARSRPGPPPGPLPVPALRLISGAGRSRPRLSAPFPPHFRISGTYNGKKPFDLERFWLPLSPARVNLGVPTRISFRTHKTPPEVCSEPTESAEPQSPRESTPSGRSARCSWTGAGGGRGDRRGHSDNQIVPGAPGARLGGHRGFRPCCGKF